MSGDHTPLFDADRIRSLLTELGLRLQPRGIDARIFIVRGAAMALAYSRNRLTRDIDAVFEPNAAVYEEAQALARDLGLPPNWLNDGVKGFLPDAAPPALAAEIFSAPGMSVGIASPEYMLAMKASAARSESDRDDLKTLIELLDIRTAEQAFEVLERHYDRRRLTPKSQFVLEELVNEANSDRAPRRSSSREQPRRRAGSGTRRRRDRGASPRTS